MVYGKGWKKIKINDQIINKIEKCLNDYGINLPQKVVVGCSGGKDSTSLLFFLRELGVEPVPMIIDLGYVNFNSSSIKETIDRYGFSAIIIKARSEKNLLTISQELKRKIIFDFEKLDSENCHTPCTHCSNVKRIFLMNETSKLGLKSILFGHHREDIVATLLKDYFIYDYYNKFGGYQKDIFEDYLKKKEIVLQEIELMVAQKRAGTMGIRLSSKNNIELLRPMAYVSETEIRNFIAINNIPTHGSGCSHEIFFNNKLMAITKREFVHEELHNRLKNNTLDGEKLLTIAKKSLDHLGRPKFFPRNNRAKLMPGFELKDEVATKTSLPYVPG